MEGSEAAPQKTQSARFAWFGSAACYKLPEVMRAAMVEFLEMTIFVYFGTGAAVALLSTNSLTLVNGVLVMQQGLMTPATVLAIAFAFGMSIMVLISGFGHLSGGHINPAVTLALYFVGACDVKRLLLYWTGQFTGAILGSALVYGSFTGISQPYTGMTPNGLGPLPSVPTISNDSAAYGPLASPPLTLGANGLSGRISVGSGFLLEMMGTFFLCMTVLMTVKHSGNMSEGKLALAPLPIGYAVFIAHIVLVPFTGCGINPGRSFGPAVVDAFAGNPSWTSSFWIYFIGPFTGAFLASMVFWLLRDASDEAKLVHPLHGLVVMQTGDAMDGASNAARGLFGGIANRAKAAGTTITGAASGATAGFTGGLTGLARRASNKPDATVPGEMSGGNTPITVDVPTPAASASSIHQA